MAKRTYYPTFMKKVGQLSVYIARHQPTMVVSLGLAGSTQATELNTLVNALNAVLADWPKYQEGP